MKVICIGLPKTGTTTLERELQRRGMKTIHGPYPTALADTTMREKLDSIARHDALLEFYGLFDLNEIASRFPDAIYINTIRPFPEWMHSCRRHFRPSRSERVQRGRRLRFGVDRFVEHKFTELYSNHQQDIHDLIHSQQIKVRNLYVTTGDDSHHLDAILEKKKALPFVQLRIGRK